MKSDTVPQNVKHRTDDKKDPRKDQDETGRSGDSPPRLKSVLRVMEKQTDDESLKG